MSSLSLSIGLRSLLAAQSGLETIGHNLANVATPGYSRQTLALASAGPLRLRGLLQGAGVDAATVARTVDALLEARLVRERASLGRSEARLAALRDVEALLGGASETNSSALLSTLFDAFASLSTAPSDPARRASGVHAASNLASALRDLASEADDLQGSTVARLRASVAGANELARKIGDLNREIAAAEGGGAVANDLRDARDLAVGELAKLAGTRAVEDGSSVRVLIGGRELVGRGTVHTLSVAGGAGGVAAELRLDGDAIEVAGGAIGGLADALEGALPNLAADLDLFARSIALEFNRAHARGVPAGGPFTALISDNAVADVDGDGDRADELLASSGLPFDVASGELVVRVTDLGSGVSTRHHVAIDAARTTAGDLAAALDAVDGLSATLGGDGKLRIAAEAGRGFDFAVGFDASPDAIGSFGGGRASLASALDGPFALAGGETLDLVGPLGAFSVTFAASDFAVPGAATAAEIAAALSTDGTFQANGLVASAVGSTLVVQTSGSGAGEAFTLAGGTAAPALGWSAPAAVAGSDTAVEPRLSGSFTGTSNRVLTLRPNGDGIVGTTAGLKVEVFDENGVKLSEIDIGAGYQPGTAVDLADGVKVAFGYGALSATDGDVARVELVADSDTSDALPALGLNSLFTGAGADSIAVRAALEDDPALFAAGSADDVARFVQLERRALAALGGATLGEHFDGMVARNGADVASARGVAEAEDLALAGLEARRASISGVNADEEMVHMLEQEKAYAAAAEYLRVVSDLTQELLDIL